MSARPIGSLSELQERLKTAIDDYRNALADVMDGEPESCAADLPSAPKEALEAES